MITPLQIFICPHDNARLSHHLNSCSQVDLHSKGLKELVETAVVGVPKRSELKRVQRKLDMVRNYIITQASSLYHICKEKQDGKFELLSVPLKELIAVTVWKV